MSIVIAGLLLAQGPWLHLAPGDGLPGGEVRSVLVSSKGAVWFAVRGVGLAVLENDAWRHVTADDGLVSNGVADLHEVGETIWAVGQGGYSVLEEGRWRAFPDVGGRTTRVIFSLRGTPGQLWFGANGFAARRDAEGFTFFGVDDGLPHAVVHQVWVDGTGATWFACRRGLARLADDTLEVFHPDVNFRSIVEDDAGRLWFGTGGDGILEHGPHGWISHLEGEAALPATVDATGRVWAHTEGSGAYVYDGEAWRRFTTEDGLPSNVVYDITTEPKGDALWFATDRGASRYVPPNDVSN